MLRKYLIYKVYKMLKNKKIKGINISPNYIAEFSYNREIYLSSEEVVYINNNYKG